MSTATTAQPSEPLSPMQRIVNVFFSPSKTFTDLNRNTSWWVAWLLISVFGLLFVYSIDQKVGFDQVVRNEIAASPKAAERMDKLAPEARDRAIETQGRIYKYTSYGVPVSFLVVAVVTAAVLMGVFNFGVGAELKFGVVLAVVMYTWVVGILKSVLAVISLYAGADPEGFNFRNPAATNLGFFINRVDHPVLHSALSWVDIFGIWYIILMGIGFSCVSKVKRGTALSVITVSYIVIALISIGFTALFS